jgi:anthranilate/para-aminobenzoate synthase component II
MKIQLKAFVVGAAHHYINWMNGATVTDSIDEANFVVFTGGEDVDPSLYDSPAHPTTSSNIVRDHLEVKIFKIALQKRKPMVGICRGAQFLCVNAGGILVQHQENSYWMHKMFTYDNKDIMVSSTHHQAQYPWGMPKNHYMVLGWSHETSKFHKSGDNQEMVNGIIEDNKEVEMAFYPEINALAIQSHPEMIYDQRGKKAINDSILYCQDLLTKFLDGTLATIHNRSFETARV